MATFAHISDLHFGRENESLLAALHEALANLQPDLVVISGDITQRALNRQFIAARTFIDDLNLPLLIIAGNHDVPVYNLAQRFISPWRQWKKYLGYELEPVVSDEEFIAVGVNTVRKTGSLLDWSRGRINIDQAEKISQTMLEAPETKLRIVVAHHPFWIPEDFRYRRLVGGVERAFEIFQESGVDVILGGHIHLPYTHLHRGIIIGHAGTTVSSRFIKGTPNSFKVIRGNREDLSFELRQWDGHRFSGSERSCFARKNDRWTSVESAKTK